MRTKPIAERLKRFSVNAETGCHEFSGRIRPSGYGELDCAGTVKVAHRVAWEFAIGPIPKGMLVCHKCDNRKCINVDHLFLGTQKDNIQDCIAKGRRGQPHPLGVPSKATLDIEKVLQIRRRYANGERAILLAAEYGVTDSCIYRVLRRETWPEWSIAARKA